MKQVLAVFTSPNVNSDSESKTKNFTWRNIIATVVRLPFSVTIFSNHVKLKIDEEKFEDRLRIGNLYILIKSFVSNINHLKLETRTFI